MNVVTDIYEYIALLADDATTLNMLSVNKKFLDENYYRRIIEKKYPHIAKLKMYNKPVEYKHVFNRESKTITYNYVMTWRQCYIKNLKCVLKIEEIFKIPYFNTKSSYFPERLLHRLCRERNAYSLLLKEAFKAGRSDIRDIILERNLVAPQNSNLLYACKSGNLALVKETYNFLSLKLKKLNLQPGIFYAIKEEKPDILKFLLEKGNHSDLNYALSRSIFKQSDALMNYLLEKGADNFIECVSLLQKRLGFTEIVKSELKTHQIKSFEEYVSSMQNKLEFLLEKCKK